MRLWNESDFDDLMYELTTSRDENMPWIEWICQDCSRWKKWEKCKTCEVLLEVFKMQNCEDLE